MITGTSSEFLGRKPLPRAVRERPLVLIMGESGVGKTSVARRLLGPEALELDHRALSRAVSLRVRRRVWDPLLLDAPALLVDGPVFLEKRVGFARHVRELVCRRIEGGLRTVVTEASAGGGLLGLVEGIPPEQRATIVLRFPVGRGRRRAALRMCEQLGIDPALAREVDGIEPWTYAGVRAALLELAGRDG